MVIWHLSKSCCKLTRKYVGTVEILWGGVNPHGHLLLVVFADTATGYGDDADNGYHCPRRYPKIQTRATKIPKY